MGRPTWAAARAAYRILSRWGSLLSRSVSAVAVGSWLVACSAPRAEPSVMCTTTYGGEERNSSVELSSEPYAATGVQIAERFEFRPVLARDANGARLLNVYTFALGREPNTRTILHQLKVVLPGLGAPLPEARFGFTGRQFVYDANARELQYWCGFRSD